MKDVGVIIYKHESVCMHVWCGAYEFKLPMSGTISTIIWQ